MMHQRGLFDRVRPGRPSAFRLPVGIDELQIEVDGPPQARVQYIVEGNRVRAVLTWLGRKPFNPHEVRE